MEVQEKRQRSSNHFPAFTVGLLIGAAIGLLYAPRTGAETRAMLRERANDVRYRTSDLVGRAKEAASRVRGKSEETLETARTEAESLRRQAQS